MRTILLVEDHKLMAEALVKVLQKKGKFQVVDGGMYLSQHLTTEE